MSAGSKIVFYTLPWCIVQCHSMFIHVKLLLIHPVTSAQQQLIMRLLWVTILVGTLIFAFHFHADKIKSKWWCDFCWRLLHKTSVFPYVWRILFVGRGFSVAAHCFIYNDNMLWHILSLSKNCSSSDLAILLGRITILIKFQLNVQPYDYTRTSPWNFHL